MKKNSTELIWKCTRTSAPSFKPTSIFKTSGWRMKWWKITLWPVPLVDIVYEHHSFLRYPAKVQKCKVQLHSHWVVCASPTCSVPQSWIFNHTGEHEFTSPGTNFMVQKKKKKNPSLSVGEILCGFPFWLGRKEGSSEGSAEQKPHSRALNCSLNEVLY